MFTRKSKNFSIFHSFSYIVMNSSSLQPFLFLGVRFISKTSSDISQSFTVSFLQNKLGFSVDSALVVSKYVNFKTPKKPDSVIAFLEKQGLSKTQIKQMIQVRPALLCSDVEKTLLPKIKFFQSKGISRPELNKLLLYNPRILSRSLNEQIIPSYNHLSNLLQSESKVVTAIRRNPYLVSCRLDAYVLPNTKTLRDNGVPESSIISMFNYHPRAFIMQPNRFKEIVMEVKEMGFNPLLLKFVLAVIIFRKVSKPAMERKFDVYKKWGWSEEEIWDAFQKHPCVMEVSEDKIAGVMDFLVNKMGFQSSFVANRPHVFVWSLEKRIVPRGLFARDLLSKGLIKTLSFSVLFGSSEEAFIQRYVNQYEDKAPGLLKLYKEKLDLAVGGKYRLV